MLLYAATDSATCHVLSHPCRRTVMGSSFAISESAVPKQRLQRIASKFRRVIAPGRSVWHRR